MRNMPLETLVIRMTQKQVHRFLQERKRYKHAIESWLEDNNDIVDIEAEMEEQDTSRHIRAAVDRLDRRQAEIVRLYFFDDLDVCEIAGRLQITEQEVRSRISNALCSLKPVLRKMDLHN